MTGDGIRGVALAAGFGAAFWVVEKAKAAVRRRRNRA